MNPLSRSGLELLRAAAAGVLPAASIAETIPMRPESVELG
ncbi:phenylacetic acid degradation protein, partial [Burkholderia pseudomallei]